MSDATQLIKWYQLLACPLCQQPLVLQNQDRTLACENNHSFDQAKQGYFHLLPVQNQKSKAPGDSKEMVIARKNFLGAGHYFPIIDEVNKVIESMQQEATTEQFNWLDAGCGEGYYTDQIAMKFKQAIGFGLDISKPAIQKAAKLNPLTNDQLHWLVASSAHGPFQSGSMDIIVSMFSRIMGAEFKRLMKPNGKLITVNAGPNHLNELKALIYDDPKPSNLNVSKLVNDQFEKISDNSIQFQIHLDKSEDIANLLMMTPHYWRAKPEKKARLAELTEIDLTVDAKIECFKVLNS